MTQWGQYDDDEFFKLCTGTTKTLDSHLLKGGSVNIVSPSGDSLLACTIYCCNYEVFNMCIKEGARLDHPNDIGETPLHVAAEVDNFYVASELLRNGVYVDPVDAAGDTPLMVAIRHKHHLVTWLLLSKGANVNFINTSKAVVPLTLAIESCDSYLINLILQCWPKLSLARIQGFSGSQLLRIEDSPLAYVLKQRSPGSSPTQPNWSLFLKVLQHSATVLGVWKEDYVHELDWTLGQNNLPAALVLIAIGTRLSSCGRHKVLHAISGKISVVNVHFAAGLLQYFPWTTHSSPCNFLLKFVLGTFCRHKRDCCVERYHTVGHCRMTAALLHLGLPMSHFVRFAQNGKFDRCECRHWIPSPLNAQLKTFNPVSLKAQCRTVIRDRIGYGIGWKVGTFVTRMLLSTDLMQYLVFEYEQLHRILSPAVPAHTLDINKWN